MTIAITVIAVILLVLHWKGPNAVWGGATLGTVVGVVLGFINGDWSLLAVSFAYGTFAGTVFEWIGRLTGRWRRE